MSLILVLVLALVTGTGLSGCVHDDREETIEAERAADPPASAFVRLRSRPLRLPQMPRDTCRMTPKLSPATANVPGRPGEAALGDGPVYVAFRGIPRKLDAFPAERAGLSPSKWRASRTVWISAPEYRGPVLVRGRRVDGPGRIDFGSAATHSPELRLQAGRWDERANDFHKWDRAARQGWRFAIAYARIRVGGCFALQIDGRSFSDVVVFVAIIQR